MPDTERERLRLLHALKLLDTDPEPIFDRVTRVLSNALGVPMALISLVDEDRQWFKSRVGLDVTETARDIAFCDHAIRQEGPFVVEDAARDDRFADNPLVTEAPDIRFYAGMPLRTSEGYAIGTLCAIDRRPRQLTPEQQQTLADLAELVTRELHMREAALLSRNQLARSDARVEDSESRFRTMFESAAIGIALAAPDGHWLRVNQALCETVGYPMEELLQLSFQDITLPEDLETDLALLSRLIAGEIDSYQLEKRYIRKDGVVVWINLMVTKQLTRDGALDYFVAIVENIQARKEAEASLEALRLSLEHQVEARTFDLQRREAELSTVLEKASDAYVSVDENGRIRVWNRRAEETFGWERQQVLGRNIVQLLMPDESRLSFLRAVRRTTAHGRIPDGRLELLMRHGHGHNLPVDVRIARIELPEQTIYSGFLHDISARRAEQAQREREALQDALTGLGNRRAMYERLPQVIARVRRKGASAALLFVDLDGFKQVNDHFGHDAGDRLLQEISARLRLQIRMSDTVYRLAGDEFTVLLEDLVNGEHDARLVAEKLLGSIVDPIDLQHATASVGASIGLAVYGQHDDRSPEEWVKSADVAMYEAKRSGKGNVRIG